MTYYKKYKAAVAINHTRSNLRLNNMMHIYAAYFFNVKVISISRFHDRISLLIFDIISDVNTIPGLYFSFITHSVNRDGKC